MKKLRLWWGYFAQGHTDSLSWLTLKTPLLTALHMWYIAGAQQTGEINIRTDELDHSGGRGKAVLNEASGQHCASPTESSLL